jgi:hypothetical protein
MKGEYICPRAGPYCGSNGDTSKEAGRELLSWLALSPYLFVHDPTNRDADRSPIKVLGWMWMELQPTQ